MDFMNFLKKLFLPSEPKIQPAKPTTTYDISLIPNEKYRLTRQMFLFQTQEVSPDVNAYLKIGEIVSYLKSGEIFEENSILAPWVYVRSRKGREGWCFAHNLVQVE